MANDYSDIWSLRPFAPLDLLKFNNINVDFFTETFNLSFYNDYFVNSSEFCWALVGSDGITLLGYIMGKTDRKGQVFHGHVTALTVAPPFRRCGLSQVLMTKGLEQPFSKLKQCIFIDLYVRVSNAIAIRAYEKWGYYTHEKVENYYSESEDAFDMRKYLDLDKR